MNPSKFHSQAPLPSFRNFRFSFDKGSAALVATVVLTTLSAAHAQTATPSPDRRDAPPSQIMPQSDAGSSAKSGTPRATGPDLGAVFTRADTNKDGKLDAKEVDVLPGVAQRFEMLDANRDGFLSPDEFSKVAGS